MKWIKKSVCFPEGFKSSGIRCGIKKEGLDLGLLCSDEPCRVAAVFTTNRVKAAPVIVSQRKLKEKDLFRGVVVNSGNANCCTGMKGIEDAKEMAKLAARHLGIPEDEILVCSTGVIGEPLPMDKIREGIPLAVQALSEEDGDFSRSILTTDTHPKTLAVEVEERDFRFRIGGCAKGAGMIYPNMATMLAFITTDVELPADVLQKALKEAVNASFNRISVDGDQSTNDTVMLFSKTGRPLPSELYSRFKDALTRLCESLALMIVSDGEGATKVVKVVVEGAPSEEDAEKAARKIANSLLFKTALFGEDPNWGRIMGALGASGAEINPEIVDIYYDNIKLVSGGMLSSKKAEEEAKKIMKRDRIEIKVDLKLGKGRYHVWTCDLSYDYVRINAEYRS